MALTLDFESRRNYVGFSKLEKSATLVGMSLRQQHPKRGTDNVPNYHDWLRFARPNDAFAL